MQIFNDKKNKEFASYFQEILDADAYYKEIKCLALKLKGNTVELINLNYKKEVSVLVDIMEANNFEGNPLDFGTQEWIYGELVTLNLSVKGLEIMQGE